MLTTGPMMRYLDWEVFQAQRQSRRSASPGGWWGQDPLVVDVASGCASHGGRGVELVRDGKRTSCVHVERALPGVWRARQGLIVIEGDMGMTVGQAYSKLLSARERKVLAAGCDVLIDQVFDALQEIKEPQDVAHTTLGLCLPPRYVYKVHALFLQALFGVSSYRCLETCSTEAHVAVIGGRGACGCGHY